MASTSLTQKPSCPDCGNAPVPHLLQKWSVTMDKGVSRLNDMGRPILRFLEPRLNRFVDRRFPGLFRFLTSVGLGTILTAPDEYMSGREKAFWEEGTRRGIVIWAYRPIPRGNSISVAEWDEKTLVYDTIPRPGDAPSPGSDWMDDKDICHSMFERYGIPMAKSGVVRTWGEAQKLFRTLTPPVIAKPARGSRSRHTTTHIDTLPELRIAFEKAKQIAPWIIIEEELVGLVYRGTVIGGKVIGILRREPAMVTGDGIHTVRELIEKENQNPLRKGPIFHEIQIHDVEHDKELSRHGMTLDSIPAKDMLVTLSQKASRGLGGGATDVTDDAHPDIISMLESVARVLDDPLVGVDFIVDDVKRSWKEQPRAGVIECNSAPFIDLHLYPLVGKPRNTPGALWDLILVSSAKGK